MKKVIRNISIATVTGMIAVTTARGQLNTNSIIVDEFGTGFYNGTLLPSAVLPDPANGGAPGFAYTLPFTYTWPALAADIQLFEPGTTQLSDLLRFTRNPNGPGTLLFFYSDASSADPPDSPADQFPFPTQSFLYTSGVEIGLFGNSYSEAGPNGFVYTALPGQPGEDGTGVALQYTFVSDGVVPEPNASVLASLGGGCLLLGLRSLRTLRRK